MIVGINVLGIGASKEEKERHVQYYLERRGRANNLENYVLNAILETEQKLEGIQKRSFSRLVKTLLWRNEFKDEAEEEIVEAFMGLAGLRKRAQYTEKKPKLKQSLTNSLKDQCHRYMSQRTHSPMDPVAIHNFTIGFYEKVPRVILSELKKAQKLGIYKQFEQKAKKYGLIE